MSGRSGSHRLPTQMKQPGVALIVVIECVHIMLEERGAGMGNLIFRKEKRSQSSFLSSLVFNSFI